MLLFFIKDKFVTRNQLVSLAGDLTNIWLTSTKLEPSFITQINSQWKPTDFSMTAVVNDRLKKDSEIFQVKKVDH